MGFLLLNSSKIWNIVFRLCKHCAKAVPNLILTHGQVQILTSKSPVTTGCNGERDGTGKDTAQPAQYKGKQAVLPAAAVVLTAIVMSSTYFLPKTEAHSCSSVVTLLQSFRSRD